MNPKSLLLAVLAGFIFIFASDFLIHAIWLDPDYKATASLWRPEAEMQQRFAWMLIGQLLCAIAFAVLWAKGFAGQPVSTGAFFGFFMGVGQQVWAIAFFVVAPLPGMIATKWFCSGVLQALLLGMIVALIYKPAARRV
ncbi:MAG TPA: hypothetical protein VK474_07410 [Chthoniobacterales bacterium]|nr:hypothetical protein [Chthoniobacterales bacterium]